MIDTLLGLSIPFSTITNFIRLRIKNHKARASIAFLSALVILVTFILLWGQACFSVRYSLPTLWASLILVLDCIILVYFLFVAIRELVWGSIDLFGGEVSVSQSC